MSGLANFLGGSSPIQEGGRRRRRRGSKTHKKAHKGKSRKGKSRRRGRKSRKH